MRPHEFIWASSLPDYECNHCGLPPEHNVHHRLYVDAWCKRCSQKFAVYWTFTIPQSVELHRDDCIGCDPPTPMFKMEVIEVKPMDTPVSKIFDLDAKWKP